MTTRCGRPRHAVPGFLNMYHLNPVIVIISVSNPKTFIVIWWQHIQISILTVKKQLTCHYVLNLWSILIGWQVIWPNVGGTINWVWCNPSLLLQESVPISGAHQSEFIISSNDLVNQLFNTRWFSEQFPSWIFLIFHLYLSKSPHTIWGSVAPLPCEVLSAQDLVPPHPSVDWGRLFDLVAP